MENENKFTEYAKWWENVWMSCGRKETDVFESNSIAYTEDIVVGNARRNLMVWIYCLLRNYKKLTAIEDLEPDVKKKMWAFVKEVCAGKTDDVKRMKHICMVFYTIEYFINESNKS
jgi:diadenosine tetraphosphate (Ap4A) HIT family hydrolase